MEKKYTGRFSSIFCEFSNSKNTRHCGSLPSYKENGPSWSVKAGEAISFGKMLRELRGRRSEGLLRGNNSLAWLKGVLLGTYYFFVC